MIEELDEDEIPPLTPDTKEILTVLQVCFSVFPVVLKVTYLIILGKGQISYNNRETFLRRSLHKSAPKVLVCPFPKILCRM